MNKDLIDKFKTITKKIENPIIKNLLIEMIDTIEEQSKKITNLEDENENLKITKAGQKATIEILKEENIKLKQQLLENKISLKDIEYKEKIKLQQRIDKAIEYIKSYNLPEDLRSLSECPISVGELKQLLNILQGEDKDDTNSR